MTLMGLMALTLSAGANNPTVYISLGRKKAITAGVDEFVGRVVVGNRINGFFKDTASDPARLAKIQEEPFYLAGSSASNIQTDLRRPKHPRTFTIRMDKRGPR
jgi:hypothetical protein